MNLTLFYVDLELIESSFLFTTLKDISTHFTKAIYHAQ